MAKAERMAELFKLFICNNLGVNYYYPKSFVSKDNLSFLYIQINILIWIRIFWIVSLLVLSIIKKNKKYFKKVLTFCEKYDTIALPLSEGFFCAQIWDTHTFAIEGGIDGLNPNSIRRCRKLWESKLHSPALNASKEIMTQRKTRRMIRTDWNLTSIASSAASTLFTKSLSDWGGIIWLSQQKEV